jgi:Arylsulfotransferase (ASST)
MQRTSRSLDVAPPTEATGNSGLLWARQSRRQFLALGTGVLGSVALAACGASRPAPRAQPATTAIYRTRPDLKPVLIDATRGSGVPGPGVICITPSGPALVDNAGEPVWVRPVPHASTNLRVQNFRGQPVLTWWEGEITHYGVGQVGECVVLDSSYRELMRVRAHNGLQADLHEFLITGDGVAYLTAYRHYAADLRSVGGPKNGTALDATVQGIDLTTGSLVFEWHSADHIDFSESYQKYSEKAPYDPVHLNSVDQTADGNLLFSARNTWAVYKVDRGTGGIMWRLGGKKSDFELGPHVRFAWQHDARSHPDGTVTIFDDEGDPPEGTQSRGLILNVDEGSRTATLAQLFAHPKRSIRAGSQGSVQRLPDGNVFVGWGAEPYYTEFTRDGTMVLDAKFATGESYRAFRFEWTGKPTDLPAIVLGTSRSGQRTLYVSWNGSTETARWQVLAGRSPSTLMVVDEVQRSGFETAIPLRVSGGRVAVRALDEGGNVLGKSKTLRA